MVTIIASGVSGVTILTDINLFIQQAFLDLYKRSWLMLHMVMWYGS